MNEDLFPELHTVGDIAVYLRRAVAEWAEAAEGGDTDGSARMPLAVAEPGPLMVQAVEAAGPDGLPRKALLHVFEPVGEARLERGIEQMTSSQRILTCVVPTYDTAGGPSRQIVYRAIKFISGASGRHGDR